MLKSKHWADSQGQKFTRGTTKRAMIFICLDCFKPVRYEARLVRKYFSEKILYYFKLREVSELVKRQNNFLDICLDADEYLSISCSRIVRIEIITPFLVGVRVVVTMILPKFTEHLLISMNDWVTMMAHNWCVLESNFAMRRLWIQFGWSTSPWFNFFLEIAI